MGSLFPRYSYTPIPDSPTPPTQTWTRWFWTTRRTRSRTLQCNCWRISIQLRRRLRQLLFSTANHSQTGLFVDNKLVRECEIYLALELLLSLWFPLPISHALLHMHTDPLLWGTLLQYQSLPMLIWNLFHKKELFIRITMTYLCFWEVIWIKSYDLTRDLTARECESVCKSERVQTPIPNLPMNLISLERALSEKSEYVTLPVRSALMRELWHARAVRELDS